LKEEHDAGKDEHEAGGAREAAEDHS
jgi:hypothetical protein